MTPAISTIPARYSGGWQVGAGSVHMCCNTWCVQ